MITARERWSFAAGDIGWNFVWQSIELYLLYFYIRGLGLSPQVAATIFLAGAAMDWLVDPLVGTLADRAAPRVPVRAWVLVGGPLSVVLLAAAFTTPPVAAAYLPVVVLVIHLALRASYSLGNIPYAALTARISARPKDHLALTGARMQGAAIGGLIAAAVYALLPATTGGADFRDGALLLAVLALPAFCATYFGVRERVAPTAMRREPLLHSLAGTVELVRRSPALRRLLAVIMSAGLAVTVVNKSILFLFEELGAPRLGFYVALVPSASLLLTAPWWTLLARRVGRGTALTIAALIKAGATVLALYLGNRTAVVGMTAIAIVAGCGLSIMFWSLVPAALADCEARMANEGCAGRVYALSNIARKLAQALAPQVIALSLLRPELSTLWGMAITAAIALTVVLLYRPQTPGEVVGPMLDEGLGRDTA
ncbi:MFS transporter [Sphingosinicellaceae bacterium]|nr:MFS transporter [Sphingosinicellaceae bacterium]